MLNLRRFLIVVVLVVAIPLIWLPAFGGAANPPITFLTWDAGGVNWNNPDLWSVNKMSEVAGTKVTVVPVPADGFREKFGTILAGGNLSDINVMFGGHEYAKEYGPRGFFLPIDRHLDKLPNLKAYLDKAPYLYKDLRAPDGHIYSLPIIAEFPYLSGGFVIRGDLLKKYGIDPKTLDTWDALYDALKKLTKGEGVPAWVGRGGPIPPGLQTMWHTGGAGGLVGGESSIGATGIRYDYITNSYKFGLEDANFKRMMQFVKKALDEGVMDPEIFTMREEKWRQVLASGKGFFSIDNWSSLGPILELKDKPGPPELIAILPPKAPDDGTRKNIVEAWSMLGWPGIAPAVSAKTRNLNATLKLVDWLYTHEGRDFMNFGPEGKGWRRDADGTRRWLLQRNPEKGMNFYDWGVNLIVRTTWVISPEIMFYTYRDYEGNWRGFGAAANKMYEDAGTIAPPKPTLLQFTQDELDERKALETPLSTFLQEQLSLFLQGKRSMNEWESFVAQAKGMKVDRLLKIWNTALERWNK
jgi:putative aldouronate transport system substrate-binding protein